MDIKKLNSMTKYPSILTYHEIGDKGRLSETLTNNESFNETTYLYEKIDGENARIIFINYQSGVDYFIGSRENMLYAKGDRVGDKHGNIAEMLTPEAERLSKLIFNNSDAFITVMYQESYGGKTRKTKNYTSTGKQSWRVFDMFSLTYGESQALFEKTLEQIALWRDKGNQPFYNVKKLSSECSRLDSETAPLLDVKSGEYIPWSLEDTYGLLNNYEKTKVGIDVEGKSEGLIARTFDRKMIRKIRFEDYERTLKINKNKK